jgi:hypothetical protein
MRAACSTLLVSALTLGCGGPDVSALASSEVELSASAIALDPEIASVGEPQGGLGVTRVYLSLSSLTLVPCHADAQEIVLGPRGYELLAEPPPRELVSTSVTKLCQVRFDIDPLSQNAADGVPEGSAIYVEGTDAEGAELQLASDSSSSVTLSSVDGEGFDGVPLLLAFDVSVWLEGVTLTKLEQVPDAVHELVDSHTESAFSLFADLNGDQQLQQDETPPVASPAPP